MSTEISEGPLGLGHVGITVSDLDAAVEWYQDVLGFELLTGPETIEADESHGGTGAALVLGPKFKKVRVAQLRAGAGVGIELFEFLEPANEVPDDLFEYWKLGISHICVHAPDIDRVAERISATGGTIRVPVRDFIVGEPYRWAYCEDPFGTIVELWSHTHSEVFTPGGGGSA